MGNYAMHATREERVPRAKESQQPMALPADSGNDSMFDLGRTTLRLAIGWSKLTGLLLLLVIVSPHTVCGQATDARDSAWRVGLGRKKITPEDLMWMSGYGARDRPAEGKLTELWAKAMAIEDPSGRRFVLVTLDLVGIDRDTARAITQGVRHAYDLPRAAIALSTTHTHSGPVVGDNLRAMYFIDQDAWGRVRQYTVDLQERVISVVGQALNDLQPAELGWTVGQASFAVNRRNNTEREVPQLREADRLKGPVDHDVPILVARSPDGDYRAIICGYACHATVLSGYQWCGDWPGFAQTALEERFPNTQAMVWAGCGADQNPLPRREVELARKYGQQIAQAVADALGVELTPVEGRLAAGYQEIDIPFAELPSRDELQQATQSSNRYEAGRAELLLERWDAEGGLSETYPYPVQTLTLGDGPLWVFLGGEVVVDYALRLKRESGAERTWVAGYCNDVMAYIPSVRVLREGGYEGGGAMVYYGLPSPWAESVEEQIIEEVHRQLNELREPAADAPR
jgi:neutral ceramidase